MKSITPDNRSRTIVMALAVNACLVFNIDAIAADAQFIEPIKSGSVVQLFDQPGAKQSVTTAPAASMPLRVEGKEQNGFYPVKVDGKSYWVDGMDVKMRRDSKTACTMSAGVPAAGTLGAATNRCVGK